MTAPARPTSALAASAAHRRPVDHAPPPGAPLAGPGDDPHHDPRYDPADDPAGDPEGFAALLAQVERDHGFRVTSYKERCLRRRVGVRMRATGTHRFADYGARLRGDPREYERLLDALTINVTKLFRNWDAWAAVDALVLPGLVARGGPVRAWSAGCARGEEAYSLAALLHARAAALHPALAPNGASVRARPEVQVLGTDVDSASVRAAVAGVFTEPAFAETPAELRARYFAEPAPEPGARVAPALRAVTRFLAHDLLRDPAPDGPWDLIACRNVVIYFDRLAQDALFERFHAALAPGGVLFLGRVETLLGHTRALFTPVDARQRIFRKV